MEMDLDCDEKKPTIDPGITYFDHFNGLLWEVCPLDNSHYCRKKRIKSHVESCKQKLLKGPRKVECPFNPLHVVNLMEIENHIMTCENRVVQTNNLHDFEPKRETIEGVVEAPVNFVLEVPNTWEDGENPERGYDGMDATKFRSVLRPVPPGLSKTQKKAWRAKERQRWESLTGETKEKQRSSPYPTPTQIRNARAASTQVAAAIKDDSDILSIIDKLSGANIADPRDSMMKRINARLKTLQLMEDKLKEEKMELQRQVEEYLASIGKTDQELSIKIEPLDPRTASRNNRDFQPISASNCSPKVNADPRVAAVPRNPNR